MIDLEFIDWEEQVACSEVKNANDCCLCDGLFASPKGITNRWGQSRDSFRCWNEIGHTGECYWIDEGGYWGAPDKIYHGPRLK